MDEQLVNSIGITDNEVRAALNDSGISGIGAAAVAAVRKIANSKLNLKNRLVTPTKASFLVNADKLPSGTKAEIEKGNAAMRDVAFYNRYKINAAGKTNMVRATDNLKVGTKNFDKQKLPVSVSINRIELKAVAAATTGSPTAYGVAYAAISDSLKVELLNGEFRLVVGTRVAFECAVKDFQFGQRNQDSPKVGINLETPIFIRNDESVDFEVELPDGVTMSDSATNTYFLETTIKGIGLYEKLS